jgi:hypothetical protein
MTRRAAATGNEAVDEEYSYEEFLKHFAPESNEREELRQSDPEKLGQDIVREAYEQMVQRRALSQ